MVSDRALPSPNASARTPRVSKLAQYPPALVLWGWVRENYRGVPIAIVPKVLACELSMHFQTVQRAKDVLLEQGLIYPAGVAPTEGPGRPAALYSAKLPLVTGCT